MCWISALTAGLYACHPQSEDAPRTGNLGTVTSTNAAPGCGNEVLEAPEQCDDGNMENLDGCDSNCHFEQVVRFNALTMRFDGGPLACNNAIGGAIGSAAQGPLQSGIDTSIKSGSISTLCQFRELEDLNGGEGSTSVGCMTGRPSPSASYDGSSDLDWWYHANASDLDDDRIPRARLGGTMHEGVFTAGPGAIVLSLNLGGGSAQLALSSVIVRANLGTPRVPRIHVTLPRGHHESENIDPALTSFRSLEGGELCGNISAASLATLPVPAQIRSGGANACWEGYTADNSMLDVLVGGCSIFWVTPIAATQPDASEDGNRYALGAGANRVVDACSDENGDPVELDACLHAASYSIAIRFTADRVVVIGVE